MSVRPATGIIKALAIGSAALLWITHAGAATACTPVRPKREWVQFSRIVAEMKDISLAQVVNIQALPNPPSESLLEPTHKFTLKTYSSLKGSSPTTFTLLGRIDEDPARSAKASSADHEGVGIFWTLFAPMCYIEAPIVLSDKQKLLVMRTQDDQFPGYRINLRVIEHEDDTLIETIRALIRNPTLEKGRVAPFERFLLESSSIQIVQTTDCGKWRLIKTIWGKPVSMENLLEDEDWIWKRSECDIGRQRLIVSVPSGWPGNSGQLQLKISPGSSVVDFTGLQQGTDQGLVRFDLEDGETNPFSPAALWYSQINFTGKLVWTISELESLLRSKTTPQPVEAH